MSDNWVQETSERMYQERGTRIENLNGVSWFHAPLPPRFHRCKAQTRGVMGWFESIDRCACGATRVSGQVFGHWIGKNETRKFRKRMR